MINKHIAAYFEQHKLAALFFDHQILNWMKVICRGKQINCKSGCSSFRFKSAQQSKASRSFSLCVYKYIHTFSGKSNNNNNSIFLLFSFCFFHFNENQKERASKRAGIGLQCNHDHEPASWWWCLLECKFPQILLDS